MNYKILHIGPIKNSAPVNGGEEKCKWEMGIGVDGPSRSILGLANALAAKGIEVGVLSTKVFDAAKTTAPENLKYLTPYTGRKYNPFISTKKWMATILEQFGRPDIVNFHDVYDLFSCRLASAMRRAEWSYIVTPRGGLRVYAQRRDSWKKKIANPLFFKRYLRGAVLIHTLADGEAKDVEIFDPQLKTVVVPNGIPKEYLTLPEIMKSKKGQNEIVVGFIGQLFVEIKGIDLLLGAVKNFQMTSGGRKLKFIFVGPIKREDDKKWIEKLAFELPHKENVEFVGPKYGREKWEYLNSFDVFALTSRTEGMPVVALEAMACAKPCLFTSGTNMEKIIEDADGGWSCDTSLESIFQRLIEISNMSMERMRDCGRNAQRYVADNLVWDVVTGKYMDMIKGILCRSC